MKLSIVIVNFNSWNVLRPCLASVFRETRTSPTEVIVVDNASTDGSCESIARDFPQAKVLRNERNLGFAAANNRGIEIATGKFILLLNPDTVVLDGTIDTSVEFLEWHPAAGIVGCRLLFPDRSLQRSLYSFPSLWNIFCETFFLEKLLPGTRLFGNYTLTNFDYNTERQADAVCGAYLLFRRELVSRVGMLDEQFYMYTEEIDFCYRAKQEGYEVWFNPGGEILHFWGGQSATNRRILLWTVGSQMLYFQKHFRGVRKAAIIGLKYFGVILRGIVYSVAGMLLLRRALLHKASFYIFTAWKLPLGGWRYRPGYTGPVEPWQWV